MRLAVLSLIVLSSVSCFQEPPADRMWRCTVDKPLCPDGQTCVNDWCVKEGTAQPDLSMIGDGGGTLDLTTAKPCQDGFPLGTQGVWACRGKFSPTTLKASSLCQNGYKLCTGGQKVTDAECSSTALTSFFMADVPGSGATISAVKCSTGTGTGWGSAWFGCGWTATAGGSNRSNFPCLGLPMVLPCDIKNSLTCNFNDGRLDSQTNDDTKNGVLCCPT